MLLQKNCETFLPNNDEFSGWLISKANPPSPLPPPPPRSQQCLFRGDAKFHYGEKCLDSTLLTQYNELIAHLNEFNS